MIENDAVDLKNNRTANKTMKEDTSYIDKYPAFSRCVETKFFEMKNENSAIRITPEHLSFKFDSLSLEVIDISQEFTVLNISSHLVKVLVLPTQTQYFTFSYIPTNWLAPGMRLVINVKFQPTLPRLYNDWLRVCCYSDCNLMVPIKAMPVHVNSSNIPEKINFGCVSLGKKVVYKLTLEPVKNVVVKFMFIIISDLKDCKVEPSQGIVEDVPIEIEISYSPTRYITACIPVHLYLPPIMMTPQYFTIEAVTKPENKSENLVTTGNQTERKISFEPKHEKLSSMTGKKQKVARFQQPIKIKRETDTQTLTKHDINILLMRKEVPERDPEEQLGPDGKFLDESQELKNNAFNHFQKIVKELQDEDKKARLTDNKERIFDIKCPTDLRQEINNENLALHEAYQMALNPVNKGTEPIYIRQRVIRKYDKSTEWIEMDPAENDLWYFRYQKLWRFLQLTRTILINKRISRRLEILKALTPEKIQELEELEEE